MSKRRRENRDRQRDTKQNETKMKDLCGVLGHCLPSEGRQRAWMWTFSIAFFPLLFALFT